MGKSELQGESGQQSKRLRKRQFEEDDGKVEALGFVTGKPRQASGGRWAWELKAGWR